MITALLLAAASPALPVTTPDAAYGAKTIRQLKGHPPLPSRQDKTEKTDLTTRDAVCHPDPTKRVSCDHMALKAREEATAAEPALAASDSLPDAALAE